MKKAFQFLIIIFVVQLSISSCIKKNDNDNCQKFERIFNDLEIRVYDKSSNPKVEVFQELQKEDLELYINVLFESTEIGNNLKKNNLNFNNFGFTSAFADEVADQFIVPCYPIYNNINNVDSVVIEVIDTENNITLNVTDNFKYETYQGEILEVNEGINYVKSNEASELILVLLDLVETENIPNKAKFTITAYLDSGETLIKETEIIQFLE